MRKPVLLIFINACILVLVFVLLGQSLFVVQRVARVRQVSGQVVVRRDGSNRWQPLLAGAVVKSGDEMRTDSQSWAEFGWQNGTRWRLAPQSQLSIDKAIFNPAKANETAHFGLESGEVLMRVAGTLSPSSRFEIETPNAIAAVKGTVFSVAVRRGRTQVRVYQGCVDITDSSRSKKITIVPGLQARVSQLQFITVPDTDSSDFRAQPGFLRPELFSNARTLGTSSALVSGHTESGDMLTIDGTPVPVAAGGQFASRVKIATGQTRWKLASIDKYGGKTEIWQSVPTGYSN